VGASGVWGADEGMLLAHITSAAGTTKEPTHMNSTAHILMTNPLQSLPQLLVTPAFLRKERGAD
jgi:hypothetical protein